jgi:hypothetical protein
VTRALCKRLTRWAAAHLIRRLYQQQGGAISATPEQLWIEAWLWEQYGKPDTAATLRLAADSEKRR